MPQSVLTCTTSCWWLLYCVTVPLPAHWTLHWACLTVWAYTGILWQWQYTLSSSFSTTSSSSSPKMPLSLLLPPTTVGLVGIFASSSNRVYNLFQVCEVWGFTVLMLRIQRPVFIGFCVSSWVFFSPYFFWLTSVSYISRKSKHWYCH